MDRNGSAVWRGGLKDGQGTVSTQSGVLKDTQYSFLSRFENGIGTNPEELIAAAHAGCFTMSLSAQLGAASLTADEINTTATVTVERLSDGFAITKVHLVVQATVPGASPEQFATATKDAKEKCPVSKLFKAEITMDAKLL